VRSLLRTSSRPDIAETPIYCKALDCEIPAGKVIGFTDVDEVTTREGIRLRLEMTGKVYAEGETDSNAWEVRGSRPCASSAATWLRATRPAARS
jgi:secondary-alkyl amine dehydrogenase [NAD(P)+]